MLASAVKSATRPAQPRDGVRLLVSQGERVTHARFPDLADFLEPGDLLVVNDSRMLPSALGDLHVSSELSPGRWVVEPRKGRTEREWSLPGGHRARLLEPYRDSRRLWVAEVDVVDRVTYLLRHGQPIRYDYVPEAFPLKDYQTVFGRFWGSAEMPSASRPFTPATLESLRQKGVQLAPLTLHTGVSSLENDEQPYPEWFHIPGQTLRAVEKARRVIAVGTTVVRALASPQPSGWTEHVVRPGDSMPVDGLLTGLHEPRSTHLWMLEAVGGPVDAVYAEAARRDYLWHEFGDVHLLLKSEL